MSALRRPGGRRDGARAVRCRPFLTFLLLCVLVVAGSAAGAQVNVRAGWDAAAWLRADRAIELEVAGTGGERLAIFVGPNDLTDLFHRRGDRLVYRPELLPLPAGESEVVVWIVTASGWREAGRLPLRVLTRGGLEASELALQVDLDAVAAVDAGGSDPPPEENRSSTQLDFRQRAVRGGWELATAANVVGVSAVEQALRFGSEAEEAERLDLSSWSLAVRRGRFELGLGHFGWGSSRQLIQDHASRGARLRLPIGPSIDLGLATMNGSTIVGWDNFLGLERRDHRLASGTLGVELSPSRPGALRLEATALDASVRPQANYNQGVVDDREESRGWSARLLVAPNPRFRLDAGFAESRFENPVDPLLDQGAGLVPVAAVTRQAHYLDLYWALWQRTTASGSPVEVALDVDHQRAEPLYRSIGAYVQADVEQSAAQLLGTFGGATAGVSFTRSRDNLDELPSVLTTRTRRTAWNLGLPFAQLAGGGQPAPWLPTLAVAGERTVQVGDGVPVDGDFAASHVPDQVSLSHQASLQWSGAGWSLLASGNLSDQDNRQPGRERADFRGGGGGLTLFAALSERVEVTLDWRREGQRNVELDERTTTDTVGLQWTIRLPAHHQLTGSLSRTESETRPDVRASEQLLGEAQWSWGFERRRRAHGWSGRLYLRGSYLDAESADQQFGLFDRRDAWSLGLGLHLSAF